MPTLDNLKAGVPSAYDRATSVEPGGPYSLSISHTHFLVQVYEILVLEFTEPFNYICLSLGASLVNVVETVNVLHTN